MENSDKQKQVKTVRRKARVASAGSRKKLTRPAGASTASATSTTSATSTVTAVTKKASKPKAVKKTVKVKEVTRAEKAAGKVKVTAKKTTKKKPAAKKATPKQKRVTKKAPAKVPVKTSVKTPVKTSVKESAKGTTKVTVKTTAETPAEEPAKEPAEEPANFTREVKPRQAILIRSAQYRDVEVEKRPLSNMPAKKASLESDVAEQVKVRKADPEITPQENLEAQADFWAGLADSDVDKAVTNSKKPATQSRKPIDVNRVNERMRARKNIPVDAPKTPAKELKEQAIKKAIKETNKKLATDAKKKPERVRFTWGRILMILSCTAMVVCAVVYFVNLSAPDVSLRVAAMQSGIEATYPSFTPRDYSLSDITSEENKITLAFKHSDGQSSYTLTEEKSAWDSNALLTNFVKVSYDEDYTVVREQGLTLYMVKDGASWVNNGILYKLKINSGSLTKKQIKTIATSL